MKKVCVEYDLSVPIEKELFDWYESQIEKVDSLKRLTLIGYVAMLKSTAFFDRGAIRDLTDAQKKVLRAEYAQELAEAKIETIEKIANLQCERDKYRMLYEDSKASLDRYVADMHSQRLADTQKALQESQTRLAMLQKSNFGKGVKGEQTLADYLRVRFSKSEIIDSSKLRHSCDLWMRIDEAFFVAIESKNKSVVTTVDVDKFLFDVDYLKRTNPTKFLGGVFVSLRSKNIPHIGDMHVEIRSGRPVIFVSFESEEELTTSILEKSVDLICKFGRQTCRQSDSENDQSLAKLRPLLKNIENIRKTFDVVRSNAKKIMDGVSGTEKDISNLFGTIQNIINGSSC